MEILRKIDTVSAMLVITLVALLLFMVHDAMAPAPAAAHAYFLNVTLGDAELIVFPGDIKVMIDAGSDAKVVDALGKIISPNDASIDLAIISEPLPENIAGYAYVIDHYHIGAFLYGGRESMLQRATWQGLLLKIAAKKIPLITVGANDRIRFLGSAAGNSITILSPDNAFNKSPDLNDAGMVLMAETEHWKALFTANIGSRVEHFLQSTRSGDLRANIIKIAQQGSNYASGIPFLSVVDPAIAIIETGAKGIMEQASMDTLARIAGSSHAVVFQTGQKGMLEIGYDILKKRMNIVSKQ